MEASLAWTLGILLLYTRTTLTAGARPTPTSGPEQVQKPFNLRKESYNFNSALYWDYNKTSITPYFQVEYRNYEATNNVWTVVETCRNISQKSCDLSEKIVDPFFYYGVRVKAFVGSEVSGNAKTEFNLIDDGIIGPPELNASIDGKFIDIDVWYPQVNGEKNVGDYVNDLIYDVYYGNETQETDECDTSGCSAKIIFSKDQKTYCFSAQGKSESNPMTIEKSKEVCIDITPPPNGTSNTVYAIVIPVVLVVIVLLVLCFFIIKKSLTTTSKLPVALKAVRNIVNTPFQSVPTTQYDLVTVTPPDSPEEAPTQEEAHKDLNVSDDSDHGVGIDIGYQSSAGESEQKSDDGHNGNEESSSSNNYYHTENGDSSFVCIKEDITEEKEPPRDIKPVTNSFGYDKPHCPL